MSSMELTAKKVCIGFSLSKGLSLYAALALRSSDEGLLQNPPLKEARLVGVASRGVPPPGAWPLKGLEGRRSIPSLPFGNGAAT